MSQDSVVRTTARLHEPSEPERHKPIIRIETADGRTSLAHMSEANQLAYSVRASIDSGRDNPFRPDGEIYRMTDPIVDFYKFGPSRSGAQTPTYAELTNHAGDKKSKPKTRWWRRKTTPPSSSSGPRGETGKEVAAAKQQQQQQQQRKRVRHEKVEAKEEEKEELGGGGGGKTERSCWRRWLCCCCCCCSCGGQTEKTASLQAPAGRGQQFGANIDHYNRTTSPPAGQAPKSARDLIANSGLLADADDERVAPKSRHMNEDSNSTATATETQQHYKPVAHSLASTTVPVRQAKVVILDELPSEARNITELRGAATSSANNKQTNGTQLARPPKPQAEKSTSRCVVS